MLLVLVAVAVARSWEEVRATVGLIAPAELVLSELLVLVGLLTSVLTWRRALHEVGSSVRAGVASRIYLVGQLGKYVPGSVWAVAVQTELARGVGIPRARGVAASVVAMGVNVAAGLALGAALVPTLGDGYWRTGAVLALLALCAATLSPPVVTRLVNRALLIVRRPLLGQEVTWRGMGVAAGWSVISALSYGVSVWILRLP